MNTDELLAGFNQPQRDAVLYCDGPSLVIAGAGSGKTRVLTYKIAYLLTLGYDPWSILALTFTNKAAEEMKRRIAGIVGEESARYLWMGTFHSIFLRILRIEHERIGFSSNFTIYDASDSKSLIKSIIKEMGLDDKTYKPSTVAGKISMAKNQLMDEEAYYKSNDDYMDDRKAQRPMMRDVFRRYAARCRQSDAMDFDDILLFTYKLLAENPDILRKYEEAFKYVLVDEYQDTNYAQHRIVWLLTQHRQRVCVVGDDAQSIYSFRGANIDNILHFTKQYSNPKTFKLEQNYRSTQSIVNAANSLIHKNRGQIFKNVFSQLDMGDKLQYAIVQSDIVEADFVTRRLKNLKREDGLEYSDFGVLYRTNAQSRVFEEAFRKENIPYRIYGGLSFYQRKEIKDAIAYFRVAVNPHDEEALKRIINYPTRGIGATTTQRIVDVAVANEVSLWSVICNPLGFGVNLTTGAASKVEGFKRLIQSFIDDVGQADALTLGRKILEESTINKDIYQDKTPENLSRQENIHELVTGLSEFVEDRREEGDEHVLMSDYLSVVSLISDLDSDKKSDEPKVSLMTIHAAKGLEFNTVFVVGLEENLFPNQMSAGSMRELEEERRLFYVAITRAKMHCFLTSAKQRYRFGQMEFSNPSRFLRDIDSQFIQIYQQKQPASQTASLFRNVRKQVDSPTQLSRLRPMGSTRSTNSGMPIPIHTERSAPMVSDNRPSAEKSSGCEFRVGQRVHHDRFGDGVIEKIEGVGENTKAFVNFTHVGVKQLLLRYARLKANL